MQSPHVTIAETSQTGRKRTRFRKDLFSPPVVCRLAKGFEEAAAGDIGELTDSTPTQSSSAGNKSVSSLTDDSHVGDVQDAATLRSSSRIRKYQHHTSD